ncbi:MAG: 3-deoxy-7-phosphoheptulonate synthase [Spirochaetota bacterium]
MIIVMKNNASEKSKNYVMNKLNEIGINYNITNIKDKLIICCTDYDKIKHGDISFLKRNKDVVNLIDISSSNKLVYKNENKLKTIINIDDVRIGADELVLIAGPCAVESKEQIKETAHFIKEHNAKILRGGIFKPRTSPYSFSGIGLKGLEYIKEACEETGLKNVCEVLDISDISAMKDYVDIFQVGTRNMYNYPLLKELGKRDKPVLLKRALSGSVEEWLMSAEYILLEGNHNVMLCERGIRTFNTYTRNTLDISVVPYIKTISHLPVIVDPSHAAGIHNLVPPLAMASVSAGADAVMIEVHSQPDKSLSDSEQTISLQEYAKISGQLLEIKKLLE